MTKFIEEVIEVKVKVLTTDELVAANKESIAKKYNRGFVEDIYDKLDPLGKHLVVDNMLHNDDHIRTLLLIKVKDQTFPLVGILDIDIKTFNTLQEIEV